MTMNYGLSPAEQAGRRAAQRLGTATSSGLGMNMGISPMSNLEMTRRSVPPLRTTSPMLYDALRTGWPRSNYSQLPMAGRESYTAAPQPPFSPAPPTVRAGAPVNISGGLPPTSRMGTGGMPSAPVASGPISSNYGTLPFQPPYINVNYPPNNTLEKWGVRPEINSLWNRYRTGEMPGTIPNLWPKYTSGQIPGTIPNLLNQGVNPMERMGNLRYPLPYGQGF